MGETPCEFTNNDGLRTFVITRQTKSKGAIMDRTIKFRAWDKYEDGINCMIGHDNLMRQRYAKDTDNIFNDDTHIIMQFTGLLDKNGKEIYEGDVVQVRKHGRWKVRWGMDGWVLQRLNNNPTMAKLTTYTSYIDETNMLDMYTIIGNIYESPELLNEKS